MDRNLKRDQIKDEDIR